MSALEKLAAFVSTFRPDYRLMEEVRLHVADTLGAWIAATRTDEGKLLTRYRRTGTGPQDRIAINCALARLSEVDDIHLASMITPGSIIVPSAMTMASVMPHLDSMDVAAAIVGGYEAMIRVGAAIDGPSVLYRGIWPTYFTAPLGVAAVASRLMQLDTRDTLQALATAVIMMTPGTGHHAAQSTARWFVVGQAAARGLTAALSARSGFTSDPRLVEGEFMKGVYGLTPNAALIEKGFGEPALSQVSFKPWCAARQTMAATQALKEIMEEGVSVSDITGIEVSVLPPHLKMIDHGVTTGDRFSYLTSLHYNMAVAALAPDAAFALSGLEHLPREFPDFMSLIKVSAVDGLPPEYPKAWPAKITVTTTTGRHERSVTHVPGDPARPFGEADLRRKFRKLVEPVPADQADEMFTRALEALDEPSGLPRDIEMIDPDR
jgi:2-methylcitrate dehydratase PrpD